MMIKVINDVTVKKTYYHSAVAKVLIKTTQESSKLQVAKSF